MPKQSIPPNVTSLRARLRNVEKDETARNRIENLLALVVVSQMVPSAAIKGGSALLLRLGEAARGTKDIDVARNTSEPEFLRAFETNLHAGWAGFRGTLKPKSSPAPGDLDPAYAAQRFSVKLTYNGQHWKSVNLDLAHNEIGIADHIAYALAPELAAIFESLGLPTPTAAPVLEAEYQVAQKLHAVSLPGNDRAHDLIDLQLYDRHCELDTGTLKPLCRRLFAYRRQQEWPPTVVQQPGWEEKYVQQSKALGSGLQVLGLNDAIEWCNEFINRIEEP